MPDQSGTVRSVAWDQVLPWLMIVRVVKLATSVPVLFVAMVGVLLMPLGGWGASYLLPQEDRHVADPVDDQLAEIWVVPQGRVASEVALPDVWSRGALYEPMATAFNSLIHPLRKMLELDVSWAELAYWALGGTWNLLVWGLLGAVITRMAVVQYGRDEREGLVGALRFVTRRYLAFLGAPFFALSGVICALLLLIPVGYLMQWGGGGVAVAAVLWVFVLIAGVTTTLFLVGLLLGWPLMWGALCTEEMGDVFEGAQRTYSYFYSRPVHYACYLLIAIVVGSVAYHIVGLVVQLVVYFSFWAVTWGVGVDTVRAALQGEGAATLGAVAIGGLNSLILTLPKAFSYGFLFAAAGVVYLLLRRDSDQIEWDVVHSPDQQARYGLPPLASDEAGVPGVEEGPGDTTS